MSYIERASQYDTHYMWPLDMKEVTLTRFVNGNKPLGNDPSKWWKTTMVTYRLGDKLTVCRFHNHDNVTLAQINLNWQDELVVKHKDGTLERVSCNMVEKGWNK